MGHVFRRTHRHCAQLDAPRRRRSTSRPRDPPGLDEPRQHRLFGARVPYTHNLPPQLVTSLFWNGQFGVQMFFAVSGFLITSLRRWGSLARVCVRDFYRLRFARIAPLLLLLLAVLSALHLAHVHNFVVSAKTGGLAQALFAALTFHVNVLEARRGYLPANWDILWSLSAEEMFYLFFPLICWIFGRGKLLMALLWVFVVLGPLGRTAFAHGNGVWREYSYLGGMDAIALGCLTALLVTARAFSQTVLRTFVAIGSILMIFTLGFSIQANRWGLARSGLEMTILAVGTCMMIAVAAQTRWQAPRAMAPLLKLGQRSYEVYLTHMFIVFGLFQLFVRAGKPMKEVLALFIAVILLSGLLGDLVARSYSEPMNRLLRRFWGDGPSRLGSVIGAPAIATIESDRVYTQSTSL
ncbi:MAG TPA: acyltransferase [Acidobacteriaceae bacterium]|nr:acyltransferase [Acidobacteriaceae bacterium]